jgi:hypothetical protein
MSHQIHCHECHEDLNAADWEANGGCCTACGSLLSPAEFAWSNPLQRLRRRMELFHDLKPAGSRHAWAI